MKLPAYAKQLLRNRRAGMHPVSVTVTHGDDWRDSGASRLAVRPGEALGRDWSCVAGLPVDLFSQSADLRDAELLQLAGEIARHAATLTISAGGSHVLAHTWAFLCRHEERGRMHWPAWWSDEIERLNERNRQRWIAEAQSWLARFAA